MSLILFHEMGHMMMGSIFNWKIDKIYIYPLGGITKFNTDINKPVIEEFLVTIMGPIFQVILYIFIKDYDCSIEFFNMFLLLFNLLPIVPLDGSKLLSVLLSIIIPYKKSISVLIKLSYFFYFVIIIYFITNISSLFMLFVSILLIFKIREEEKNESYIYNRFLLERYLKKFNFKKDILINNINKFYKYKNNIIKINNNLYSEKEALNKYFK